MRRLIYLVSLLQATQAACAETSDATAYVTDGYSSGNPSGHPTEVLAKDLASCFFPIYNNTRVLELDADDPTGCPITQRKAYLDTTGTSSSSPVSTIGSNSYEDELRFYSPTPTQVCGC